MVEAELPTRDDLRTHVLALRQITDRLPVRWLQDIEILDAAVTRLAAIVEDVAIASLEDPYLSITSTRARTGGEPIQNWRHGK